MTYPEASKYLESFVNYERESRYNYGDSFKLDRMRKLAHLLGDPQNGIRSIHVAGTKGKGSTASFIYSILKSSGFKVGLYTSPHLVSFRERIRINDSLISEEDVSFLSEKLKEAVKKLGSDEPSFFEVYTALAYLYFRKEKVNFAVYEVGMGGRLDATNIIDPLVSVIAPISYEHMDKLGHTLKEIAFEKAGIIKKNGICVSAPQEKEALDTIMEVCRERKSKLVSVGRDITFEEESCSESGEVFNVNGVCGRYTGLKTSLIGMHQVENAATAVGVIEALRSLGIVIEEESLRDGIENTRWEGRIEIIGKKPDIIVDGAQNRASARALVAAVKKIFRYNKLVLVLGVSRDKDLNGMLDELMPAADSVIITRSNVAERARDPLDIKEAIIKKDPAFKNIVVTQNVGEAVSRACKDAGKNDLILVTGSLFIVGEARKICFGRSDKD